ATLEERCTNQDMLDARVEEWTTTRGRYGLMRALQAQGVPAGVVQRGDDRIERDEHLRATGALIELNHPLLGRWAVEGIPIRMSRTPPQVGGAEGRAAPTLGLQNENVYGELLGQT